MYKSTRKTMLMAVGVLCLWVALAPAVAATTEPASGPLGRVLVVPIKGVIDRTQGALLRDALADAKGHYDLIIFEIDTPGGRIEIMSEMSREIRELAPTPTVAFVAKWAMSAGSFIAMSTDRIYMAPGSIIGDARSVVIGVDGLPAELPESVQEKITSAARAQFRALAEAKGHPEALAEAMADEGIGVKRVEYRGEVSYMTYDQVAEIEANAPESEHLKVLEIVVAQDRVCVLTTDEAVKHGLAVKAVDDLNQLLQSEGVPGDIVERPEPISPDRVAGPAVAATTEPAAAGQIADACGAVGRVLVVPIEGVIDRTQGAFLHRVLSDAKGNYDLIIFEIDTPGGRIHIMSEMSREIRNLAPTPTVAFVAKWALSAGSFIAMSTDRIYMAPGSVIGDARGIIIGGDGLPVQLSEAVEEKIASGNRAEFRALAETKGYPKALAEAMTDENIGVKKVEYRGEVSYMTYDQVAEIEANAAESEHLKVIQIVVAQGKLCTLTAQEAVKYDLAAEIVDDLDDVLRTEGLADDVVERQAQNSSDKVLAILTTPQIVSLLILVGFGGVWLEFKIPGFGVPGSLAVVMFVTVFTSQALVGHANGLEILLFVVGLILLGIEIFVTPGFGFIGAAGIASTLIALMLATQSFVLPEAPWQYRVVETNLIAVLGGVLGSFFVLALAAWLLPSTPLFNRLTLQRQLKTEDGFSSGVSEGTSLVGQQGVVTSALRPAGKMQIGDKMYSVVSDAEFVPAGRVASVVRVDGPRIVVRAAEMEETQEPKFQP